MVGLTSLNHFDIFAEMKKGFLHLLMALSSVGIQVGCDTLPWNDCTKGEGNSFTQITSAAPTDKFRFEVPSQVTLYQDSDLVKIEVEVLAQQNVFENLRIEVLDDGFLAFTLTECITAYNPIEVIIRTKNIRNIEVLGPVDIFTENLLYTDSLSVKHQSTGAVNMSWRADRTRILHKGTGEIAINGYTEELFVSHESVGTISGFNFTADSAVVNVFNAGTTELVVGDTLITNFEGGSGTVSYRGNPILLTNDSARVVDANL